jgi:hypothetical protein
MPNDSNQYMLDTLAVGDNFTRDALPPVLFSKVIDEAFLWGALLLFVSWTTAVEYFHRVSGNSITRRDA